MQKLYLFSFVFIVFMTVPNASDGCLSWPKQPVSWLFYKNTVEVVDDVNTLTAKIIKAKIDQVLASNAKTHDIKHARVYLKYYLKNDDAGETIMIKINSNKVQVPSVPNGRYALLRFILPRKKAVDKSFSQNEVHDVHYPRI